MLRVFLPRSLAGKPPESSTPPPLPTPQEASCFDSAFSATAGAQLQSVFGTEVELDGELVTVILDEEADVLIDNDTSEEFERLTVWIDKSILTQPRPDIRLVRKNIAHDRAFISTDEWKDEGDEWRMMFARRIVAQFGTENYRIK